MDGDGTSDPLRGKTALVTGAARGIGRAIAEELGRRGCRLYVLDVNRTLLGGTAGALREAGLEVEPIVCDLSDLRQIGEAVVQIRNAGGVDVLVNNASVVPPVKPLQEIPDASLQSTIAVNLTAPIVLCRLLLPDLSARPSAWIVNICSQSALYMPLAFFGTYVATKAGLKAFSECLRQELAQSSVSVLRVEPGKVRSEGYLETDLTLMPRGGGGAEPVEPSVIARAIVESMLRGRKVLHHPPINRFVLALNGVAPGLLRRSMAKDQLARARREE